MSDASKLDRRVLVAYVTGPGDIIGSYRYWARGESDPHEMSETYSGQFYSKIYEMFLSAYVISSHQRKDKFDDGWISIEHRPKTSSGKKGVLYHLAEFRYWLGVIRTIIKARADIAVVAAMEHWWLLLLLHLANIKVVPTLHCSLWPVGRKPKGFRHGIVRALNGWFWRHIPIATICISPEIERQVREIAGCKVSGSLIQAKPRYIYGYLDTILSANWDVRPFRLLFAGRIEREKGIFDLLDIADRLRGVISGGVIIEVCGSGGAANEFIANIQSRNLSDIIYFLGSQERQGMLQAYARAHSIIVPTGGNFAEGLNKVVVEGVLAGRPVIATSTCPAIELTKQSVIIVEPGDVEAMSSAVIQLASNRSFYELKRASCKEEAKPFYDIEQSWGAALSRAIQIALSDKTGKSV